MDSVDIDWQGDEACLLLNPRTPEEQKNFIRSFNWTMWPGVIWVASSGSMSLNEYKFIGLTRIVFLTSARGVNEHLKADQKDVWLNVLPKFHVGGLSIFARAFLANNQVVDQSDKTWSPHQFMDWLEEFKITLTSLVPSQVHDLILAGQKCPEPLRAIIVGGGRLSSEKYQQARALGWPVLPSYGMTEAASQIATASLSSLKVTSFPNVFPLPHWQFNISSEGELAIKGPALCSLIATIANGARSVEEVDGNQWFSTGDLGSFAEDTGLHIQGRKGQVKKVGGELVSLDKLNGTLANSLSAQGIDTKRGAAIFVPSERLGYEVSLVLEHSSISSGTAIVSEFNQQVLPYEKPKSIYYVEEIPRTPLGKIKLAVLLDDLGF